MVVVVAEAVVAVVAVAQQSLQGQWMHCSVDQLLLRLCQLLSYFGGHDLTSVRQCASTIRQGLWPMLVKVISAICPQLPSICSSLSLYLYLTLSVCR